MLMCNFTIITLHIQHVSIFHRSSSGRPWIVHLFDDDLWKMETRWRYTALITKLHTDIKHLNLISVWPRIIDINDINTN